MDSFLQQDSFVNWAEFMMDMWGTMDSGYVRVGAACVVQAAGWDWVDYWSAMIHSSHHTRHPPTSVQFFLNILIGLFLYPNILNKNFSNFHTSQSYCKLKLSCSKLSHTEHESSELSFQVCISIDLFYWTSMQHYLYIFTTRGCINSTCIYIDSFGVSSPSVQCPVCPGSIC